MHFLDQFFDFCALILGQPSIEWVNRNDLIDEVGVEALELPQLFELLLKPFFVAIWTTTWVP